MVRGTPKPRLWVIQQTLTALRLGTKGRGHTGAVNCADRGHVAPKRLVHSPRPCCPVLPFLNLIVLGR